MEPRTLLFNFVIGMGGSQNFIHGINREKYRCTRYTAVLCFVIVATVKSAIFELIIIIFVCCKLDKKAVLSPVAYPGFQHGRGRGEEGPLGRGLGEIFFSIFG